MNQSQKPLYEALIAHLNNKPISFHVPGHKYGKVFPQNENKYFQEILKTDATELTGLDDLHAPEGPILEAELLLADFYKVKKSFFLVNGSTSGNLVMVMAVCEENDFVLVQRNCHKSILNALKLAKAIPIFLEPDFERDWRIAAGVSVETVKEALSAYPQAKALIVTYPNYYGMTSNLIDMVELAHQHNIPVLVDEAHGAHFILGDPFPVSAVTLGADLVVQSAHKTLPAMTMGSFLHFNSELINLHTVMEYLRTFQSSSPSYPIMASLDIARSYLAAYKPGDIHFLIKEIEFFKDELAKTPGIRVLHYPADGDPLKVTIQSVCGQSGFELQKKLEAVGIFTELADPFNVLFVLPLIKEKQQYPFKEVLKKIKEALKETALTPIKDFTSHSNQKISTLTIGYKEMKNFKKVDIPICEAAGQIAAETIIPYPPGIPLLLMGEKITPEKLDNLKILINYKAKFQGGEALKENRLKIFQKTSEVGKDD